MATKQKVKAFKASVAADPANGKFHTLADLVAAIREPVKCEFELGGKMRQIDVARLTIEQTELIETVRRELPPPPLIKPPPGTRIAPGDERYDMRNPEYLAKQAANHRLARALTVYFGCPMFRESKPGLTNRDEIQAFVQAPPLTDLNLEIIFLAIVGEGTRVKQEVNDRVSF